MSDAGGTDNRAEVRRLSEGPRNHFFGYYGLNAWDSSQVFHLSLETEFHERPPGPEDRAKVGLVDSGTGEFLPFGETSAFNFQQGCMMHWIDAGNGEEFTHNDWEDGRLVSRAVNRQSGKTRTIGAAIAAVSPAGPVAAGLNYARMYHCRSVVGYANRRERADITDVPGDDGLYRIDLESGKSELVLSCAEVVRQSRVEHEPGQLVWFNHVLFNTDGSRILFFCRIRRNGGHINSLWTVNPDGTGLRCQLDFRHWISHFAWHDTQHMLVSADRLGKQQFLYFSDGLDDFQPLGEGAMPEDGHASFSPDGKWIVCDTYPMGHERLSGLLLYNPSSDRKVLLGRFHSEPLFTGDIRCDLHPRWSPDGKTITFDAVHEGRRQIYAVDVSPFV